MLAKKYKTLTQKIKLTSHKYFKLLLYYQLLRNVFSSTKSCLMLLRSSNTRDSNPSTQALKTLQRTAKLILRNHCTPSVCLHCSSPSSLLVAWLCSTVSFHAPHATDVLTTSTQWHRSKLSHFPLVSPPCSLGSCSSPLWGQRATHKQKCVKSEISSLTWHKLFH